MEHFFVMFCQHLLILVGFFLFPFFLIFQNQNAAGNIVQKKKKKKKRTSGKQASKLSCMYYLKYENSKLASCSVEGQVRTTFDLKDLQYLPVHKLCDCEL